MGCASSPEREKIATASSAPNVVTIESQFVQALPEVCRNAWDDNGNGLVDEGCDERQSPLTISIFWSDPAVDFDLFVIGPDQQVAQLNRLTSIGLYKTADCPDRGPERGSLEPCSVNLESVKVEEAQVTPGDYQLQIVLEKRSAESSAEIALSLGVISPVAMKNYQLFFTREHQRFEMTLHVPHGQ